MKRAKVRSAAGLVFLLLLTSSCAKESTTRSVTLVDSAEASASPKFSRAAATGLFVGMREFPQDETMKVPYAVDDAVDLAYRFCLDQRVALIPPRRVVLALSGAPQKKESKERLRQLRQANARIVTDATAADIRELLQQQAAAAGAEGLFVLSIASHGFQQNGDAYILGSTSAFGSPETSLRAATLYDVAARARRSLIFIDACRERIASGARAGAPDPAAAAPQIRRMSRVEGQVIFYAAAPGQYAFDDHVRRNGVFTESVLDGLDCKASAPDGTVIVETLQSYVDRAVRTWIRDHKGREVNPATQISMEGATRNMPLCQCWRHTAKADIRVAVDGSILTAYGADTRPLWRRDFGQPIVHAVAADLDADALYEVVVGLPDRIMVLDRDKQERWSTPRQGTPLQTFTTGDLFKKHTKQIVALWNDTGGSHVTVHDGDGTERSRFACDSRLLHVAIGCPTKMHAPKIVVATADSLLVFHPKKLDRGIPVWRQVLRAAASDAIKSLQIRDDDNNSRDDIAIATTRGTTWFNFDGKILKQTAKENWQKARNR